MCKGEEQKGGEYVLHPTKLPAEYHGLTNTNRKDAADLRILSLNQESEMIINGMVYDVSAFIKRHPGGSIIKLQLGSDASDAYNNFHIRSPKADKMLKSLPKRAVDGSYVEDALSVDYEKLRQELIAEGYFNPNLRHMAYRMAEVVAMYLAFGALVWRGYWWLGAIVAGLVLLHPALRPAPRACASLACPA